MTAAVGRLAPLPDATSLLDSRWLLIGVPVVLVVWLALVPLAFLLWQSFLTPQTAVAPTFRRSQPLHDLPGAFLGHGGEFVGLESLHRFPPGVVFCAGLFFQLKRVRRHI